LRVLFLFHLRFSVFHSSHNLLAARNGLGS
jgi:hypothetical protein